MKTDPISDRCIEDLISLHNTAVLIESGASLLSLALLTAANPNLKTIADDLATRGHRQRNEVRGILGRAGIEVRECVTEFIQRVPAKPAPVESLELGGAVGEGALHDETPPKVQRKPVTSAKKHVTKKLGKR